MAVSPRWSVIRRVACLAIASVALAGCVVVPAPWHPRYYYYR
jgi:hypothetical protein